MMSVLIAIRLRTSQTLLFLSRMMPRRRCSGPTDLLASRVASSRLYASISDTFGENWLVILVCILSFLLLLCKIISFLCDIMQSLCQKILNQHIVAVIDGIDDHRTKAGPGEDTLSQDSAGEAACQLQANHGDDGRQRVFQCVLIPHFLFLIILYLLMNWKIAFTK